jgi:amino acid transporter
VQKFLKRYDALSYILLVVNVVVYLFLPFILYQMSLVLIGVASVIFFTSFILSMVGLFKTKRKKELLWITLSISGIYIFLFFAISLVVLFIYLINS